jgi:hypothetical protein
MNSSGKLLCFKRRRYPANSREKIIIGRVSFEENSEIAFMVVKIARKKTEKRRRMLRCRRKKEISNGKLRRFILE